MVSIVQLMESYLYSGTHTMCSYYKWLRHTISMQLLLHDTCKPVTTAVCTDNIMTHLANSGDDSAIHKNTAALYITSITALRNMSFNTADREDGREGEEGDEREERKRER